MAAAASIPTYSVPVYLGPNKPPKELLAAHNKFRTELCYYFIKNGTCKNGTTCTFAHGQHELNQKWVVTKYKTKWCLNESTFGFCKFRHRCHFIHSNDLMSQNGALVPASPWFK